MPKNYNKQLEWVLILIPLTLVFIYNFNWVLEFTKG
ncbi:hypothetical protein VP249E411_P0175 [Vibrio phage 249E41-1]|nr:hypothetical protein VP249E411_P0175 [Vibrio phage 249E41-1]CAH9017272.1 hypothetical protein VP193E371_P0173 [Vibrio phage 193E37-1]